MRPRAGSGDSVRMDVFVVERFLVGWSPGEVAALVERLEAVGPELERHGVRHLESIVIPTDETCLSLFSAPDPGVVRLANDACDLPTDRVVGATTHGGAR